MYAVRVGRIFVVGARQLSLMRGESAGIGACAWLGTGSWLNLTFGCGVRARVSRPVWPLALHCGQQLDHSASVSIAALTNCKRGSSRHLPRRFRAASSAARPWVYY